MWENISFFCYIRHILHLEISLIIKTNFWFQVLRMSSTIVIKSIEINSLASWFHKQKFFITDIFNRFEVGTMNRIKFCENRYICFCNHREKFHIMRVVDSILKHEDIRSILRTKNSRKDFKEESQEIRNSWFVWFYLKNRKNQSYLWVKILWRSINTLLWEKLFKNLCHNHTTARFSNTSRNPYDKRTGTSEIKFC